jgi:hypothetical protein
MKLTNKFNSFGVTYLEALNSINIEVRVGLRNGQVVENRNSLTLEQINDLIDQANKII